MSAQVNASTEAAATRAHAKRYRSKQSRALRRRLTLHTITVWLVYTLVFIVAALVANAWLVPKIADFIVDKTATTVIYDPQEYLNAQSVNNLLQQYLLQISDEDASYEILWTSDEITVVNSDDEIETANSNSSNSENANADSESTTSNSESLIRESTSETADNSIRMYEATAIAPNSTNDDADWVDTPICALAVTKRNDDGSLNDETAYIELTPQYLAYMAALRNFHVNEHAGGSWETLPIYSDGNNAYGPFEARELSTYLFFKQLKIPVAILLYLIGCLGIVMVELRRSLRYFDDLSGAVAGLMADRTKPVELSQNLSIAQGELNKIRLEALADERAAAAAEQRKNELVAYLAHDIRTPLTSVIGYLSLLDEAGELPPAQRQKFIHTAFMKAERLEGLINEFFEITRYNLQSIPIERSTVEVRLLLQQVADEFYPQAMQRDVNITIDAPAKAAFFVDAEKIARALGNVLRNAVAYADPGTTVKICAQQIDEINDARNESATGSITDNDWQISVTDTGREISPLHLESIFEKFYREDVSRGTNAGGAGLGLAIAREIITAHGGTITAASNGGTTTFTLRIPAAYQRPAAK